MPTSAGPSRWTPPSAGLTSTPPEPGKGGARPGRTRRPRPRTLPRRPKHESPPRQRQPCTALGLSRHRRPGGRRPCLRDRHGQHPCSAKRTRPTQNPTRCRPGGPRLLIPRDPQLPSATRNPSCHPPAIRPGRPPAAARPRRRPPTSLQRRGLQTAQRRRTVHQPTQAVARPGHANGQARHRLPGRTPPRRHPHLDSRVTAEASCSPRWPHGRSCAVPHRTHQ